MNRESSTEGGPRLQSSSGFDAPFFRRFLLVAAELLLVVLVVRAFRIAEPFGFLRLAPLIFVGFVLHALLPGKYRLPFFTLLGMVGVGVVLGPKYGIALVIVALGMIALCHLPIPYWWRVLLVSGSGLGLAAVRAGWLPSPGSVASVIVPVLGAMFMFRMALYLYDLKHQKDPPSIWYGLGYFFLLPNVCFHLFPVIDFQTFRRTHYDRDPLEIYQKGVLWMLRGVTHILLYRLIYLHFLPSPTEIAGLSGVLQHMLATYGLYLRISGQFHLIVGILCLFGFNLPETHHLFYMASSFTDYWRRINIYWKDFMTKLFYFPAMLRFKRWGMAVAMSLATIVVFMSTWILHSYQWFWLRGAFPIRLVDFLFWGILCGFVIVGSLREAKRSRRRTLAPEDWSWRRALGYSTRVVGMFLGLTVLWSLWSASSFSGWIDMVALVGQSGLGQWGLLLAALVTLVGVGVALQFAQAKGVRISLVGSQPPFLLSSATVLVGASALLVLSLPEARARIGGGAAQLVASIQEERLNEQDQAHLERGYYEGLLEAPSFTSALMRIRAQTPPDWIPIMDTEFVRRLQDPILYEMVPSLEGTYMRQPFSTNRWGMADVDYEEAKPQGTLRFAVLGASHAMGSGVPRGEDFLSMVEERMNPDPPGDHERLELLNFSVGGYSLVNRRVALEEKVLRFQPDVFFLVVHNLGEEERLLSAYVSRALSDLGPTALDRWEGAFGGLGFERGMERTEIERRMDPRMDEIFRFFFREVARLCAENGVIPAIIFIPETSESPDLEGSERIMGIAREEGLVPFNLFDAYRNQTPSDIWLAEWDDHPNSLGHRLLADRFHPLLLGRWEEIAPGPGIP